MRDVAGGFFSEVLYPTSPRFQGYSVVTRSAPYGLGMELAILRDGHEVDHIPYHCLNRAFASSNPKAELARLLDLWIPQPKAADDWSREDD